MKIYLEAKIEDGSIKPLHYEAYKRQLQAAFKDKNVLITVEALKNTRSDKQNRYYWGVVIPHVLKFHEDTQGEKLSQHEAHILCLTHAMEAKIQTKKIMGLEVMYYEEKSSSKMTTKEFAEFVDKLRTFWLGLGLDIPEPRGNNLLSDFYSPETEPKDE